MLGTDVSGLFAAVPSAVWAFATAALPRRVATSSVTRVLLDMVFPPVDVSLQQFNCNV